jgi:hypothetical protein
VPGSGFGTGLASLITALNTDFDWLREHTRYLQRAQEWDKGGRPANRLLSGINVLEAKAWAAHRPMSAPEPICHKTTYAAARRCYSITSSARASSVTGISMPIVLAVFALITSSNFVGRSIGKSAGFAPLNILSTNVAAREYSSA